MKSLNKKEVLWIAIFSIGILGFMWSLLHDFLIHGVFTYGLFDKAGMVLGSIFIVIGSLLFIFERHKIYGKDRTFSSKNILFNSLFLGVLIGSILSVGILLLIERGIPSLRTARETSNGGWSIGIYFSLSCDPLNFNGDDVNNPVLTRDNVTDIQAKFVADPFIIFENDIYFMFFEAYNADTDQGDIGLATSKDGLSWSYGQIVLDEIFHLSYPCIFKWMNEYYMIPETSKTKSIRLYKAIDFPYGWSLVKTLIKGEEYVDNTIFHFNDIWWIFTHIGRESDNLYLYYAENPLGPWIEHPKSPIIEENANIARPGGQVVVFDNRIIRYAQDDDPYYGNQVWAFEIISLTTSEYAEIRIGIEPILKGFENWNTRGMHHISPLKVDHNKWIASVDGY